MVAVPAARPTQSAVFLLPTPSGRQQGPIAAWISTAGWAMAARDVWGSAWVVTADGVLAPEHVETIGSHPSLAPRRGRRVVPPIVKTAMKDVRRYVEARRFPDDFRDGPWNGSEVSLVWQRHDAFATRGLQARDQLGCPLVLFVPAPLTWEARQWDVRRPGWERLFHRVAERPALLGADLVCCGSTLVAEAVRQLGVDDDRILITPSGVDPARFVPPTDEARAEARAALGVADRFVVGWTGSFRRFHGLDMVVEAVASARRHATDVGLLLVGNGPERQRIEALCDQLDVPVVFTGTVAHQAVPTVLAAMDAAVVVSAPVGQFHYSPLKLSEYLASGIPVIAPDVGQPGELLVHDEHALLVAPGDPAALAAAVTRLREDHDLRQRLSTAGRRYAVEHRSWALQMRRVQAFLDSSGTTAPISDPAR